MFLQGAEEDETSHAAHGSKYGCYTSDCVYQLCSCAIRANKSATKYSNTEEDWEKSKKSTRAAILVLFNVYMISSIPAYYSEEL